MATITVKYANQLTTEGGATAVKIFEAADPHIHFVQNIECIQAGVAIQGYGVAMIPYGTSDYLLEAVKDGTHYYAAKSTVDLVTLGNNLTMSDSKPE